MHKLKLKIWEKALLIAVAASICFAAITASAQKNLSEKLIRLHVVGSSDSEEDQSAKLLVKDAVCAYLDVLLDGAKSREEAEIRIKNNIGEISAMAAEAAKAAGQGGASACLAVESFPTRDYDGFSLPAGSYTALRVTVGSGGGKNWWCVVFPPLCVTAAQGREAMVASGMSGDEIDLITSRYTVRFKILELIETIRNWFR